MARHVGQNYVEFPLTLLSFALYLSSLPPYLSSLALCMSSFALYTSRLPRYVSSLAHCTPRNPLSVEFHILYIALSVEFTEKSHDEKKSCPEKNHVEIWKKNHVEI